MCKTFKIITELLKAPLIYKINRITVHYQKIIMMFMYHVFPLITHAPDKINQ